MIAICSVSFKPVGAGDRDASVLQRLDHGVEGVAARRTSTSMSP